MLAGTQENVIPQFVSRRPPHQRPVARRDRPRPKRGRHAVIVFLPDRVELVVVAAGALKGQPKKRRARHVHEVFQPFVAILKVVIGLIVPRADTEEAGGRHARQIGIRHFVSRQLAGHKAVERHVAVERVHHPVSIPPGTRLLRVAFVAVGLCEPHHVEPASRLTLTKVGRREQPVHLFLVRIGRVVLEKGSDLGGGGR
jgi:hypothetical protein